MSSGVGKFIEISEALHQNDVYGISQSSREPFHSSFLAWTFDRYPSLIAPVLKPDLPATLEYREPLRSLREHKKLDLVVFHQGYMPVVVELKLTSSLTRKQLEEYNKKTITSVVKKPTKVDECQRIALTMLETSGLPEQLGWQTLSFEDVIRRIQFEGDNTYRLNSFHGALFKEYFQMIDLLCELKNTVGNVRLSDPLDLPFLKKEEGEFIKERDFVRKARFSQMQSLLQSHNSETEVTYQASFSNGTPSIEGFRQLKNHQAALGWQYQNDQLRVALKVGKGTKYPLALDRTGREEFASRKVFSTWFSITSLAEALGSKFNLEKSAQVPSATPEGTKSWVFNSYEPDFVYRYFRLPWLTPDDLLHIDERLMKLAMAIDAA